VEPEDRAVLSGGGAITLEVLGNAFATLVDQMTEQIQRTCTSFVLYSGDCSCCLCDARGDIVMQGSRDIASHVGTMHLTAHAVLDRFGSDIHPGDVFLVNDPFSGGTHVPDMRVVRPVFDGGELIAMTEANGHWDDVGGSCRGRSTSAHATCTGRACGYRRCGSSTAARAAAT
jgi:N-methylhydantoinase B